MKRQTEDSCYLNTEVNDRLDTVCVKEREKDECWEGMNQRVKEEKDAVKMKNLSEEVQE